MSVNFDIDPFHEMRYLYQIKIQNSKEPVCPARSNEWLVSCLFVTTAGKK